jgi:heme O synthase-like polyprenyltransferase
MAVEIRRHPTNASIWGLYRYSLIYLALLFLAMGIDHLFYRVPPEIINFAWRLPF